MTSSGTSISGLREQIIANAVSAYPADVQEHLEHKGSSIVKPAEIYDVIITPDPTRDQTGTPRFCAVIVNLGSKASFRVGSGVLRSIGASIEEAMMGLLMALGEVARHNFASDGVTFQAIQDDADAAETLRFESYNQMLDVKSMEDGMAE